ncbi:MAG: VOC family protein [Rhodobacteraceae bacterium]|uniref:VOC family protein n=1 Tax=Albidovulum sp. TaxID=1872424 RepID=UPI001DC1143E|nr:VOC family protein [Paracoccaceae bacterium]MCB2121845.1 VOC family protein [Paracoccaceae bacterium]MCB2139460.1 VOC family protein [Paracoccaceae bacterium]HRV64316.1 VOC family protein [Albidovulum sp.]
MLELDHIAVAGATLEAAVAHVEASLGCALGPIGRHDHMGTHNRLLGLGPDVYLEAIAIDPDAPRPDWPRWFRLDEFSGPPRLTNWIVRTDRLEDALALAPRASGVATPLARGDFRWRMGIPADGRLPFDDAFPALIEWQGGLKPQDRLADAGIRLIRLEIAHPDAMALRAALPLNDERIVILAGQKAFRATFSTPHGTRVLE